MTTIEIEIAERFEEVWKKISDYQRAEIEASVSNKLFYYGWREGIFE